MSKLWAYVPLVVPPGNPVNVGVVVATPALPGGATQQWMCAAVLLDVNPLNTTLTVIMFVTVFQVITADPVPFDWGCGGFSLSALSPGATGPVAMKVRVSARLLTAEK